MSSVTQNFLFVFFTVWFDVSSSTPYGKIDLLRYFLNPFVLCTPVLVVIIVFFTSY